MTPDLEVINLLQDWSVVYDLAESYRKQEQWQQAILAYKRSIQINPEFFWSYHHLGDVARQLQQWEIAIEAYQKAVELDPQFFWSWHNLGSTHHRLEQWSMVIPNLQEAVKLDPQFFWSWNNLGDAFINQGEWEQAITAYFRCIVLDPENQPVYRKLGQALTRRGSLEESVQYYRQQLKSAPSDSALAKLAAQPQTLIDIAQALIGNQQKPGAIIIYCLVLELRPELTNIRSLIKELISEQNQLAQQRTSSLASEAEALSTSQTKQVSNPISKAAPNSYSGAIRLRKNEPIVLAELENLCNVTQGLDRSPKELQKSLKNSFHISAWYQDKGSERLIGLAQAVTDGTFHANILDLVVYPQFKGQGFEESIITTLVKSLQETGVSNITTFATVAKSDLFQKVGFIDQSKELKSLLWPENK